MTRLLALVPAAAMFTPRRWGLRLLHACSTSHFTACRRAQRGASTATVQNQHVTANSFSSTAAHTPAPAANTAAEGPSSASLSSPAASPTRKFVYSPRLRYTAPWRSKRLTDFLVCHEDFAISIAHTYRDPVHNIVVTLIPLRHFAHPDFFRQVDDLCSQHESVLMEGRMPLTGALYSTMVPPRERVAHTRPPEHEDNEGWEPREVEKFFQPFSWGVTDSPYHTVVHAADKYDYEKLPWWCSVRFNAPVLGSLKREQHCLNMIYPLNDNRYTTFAIPWGAAHMPVMHEMLLDNGFECVGMCSLVVLKRIDGIISEGELSKMQQSQRRQARRIYYVYGVGTAAILRFLYSRISVDYRRGASVE
ncbi:hypothetical protein ABL78_4088 [Leptomonas seymouri]|uniref:Uncharacterized protein n=1 Tax=Leptomonas seymouri TaxID=5684 RepID=A0A0N1HX40_LEPSE|nr:hypothetical protein ABL78_4088 [Leptomonas seymouri]|eukprot:KPI86852.1 hypothetical protein ABL78_4088 [Leptomonas seymouri]